MASISFDERMAFSVHISPMSRGPVDIERGKRIRYVRENVLGMKSQTALADRLGKGITRGAVGNWELGKGISFENLQLIAEVSGVRLEWLSSERGPMIEGMGDKTATIARETFKPDPIPGSQLVSADTMPVYAAARGGEGHIIVNFDEIDRVKRPAMLQNVKGGYGLLITGDSMIPAFRPGETALVHPHLPPMRETDVVLYHVPPDREAEAMVKHLVGFNDREWTLEQYNPFQQFTEYRKEWQVCHRVVGKYHAR